MIRVCIIAAMACLLLSHATFAVENPVPLPISGIAMDRDLSSGNMRVTGRITNNTDQPKAPFTLYLSLWDVKGDTGKGC